MSGLALGWTRKRRDAPSREAKALMMFLADNANEQMAWPAKSTLAEDMMCSEKTVMRLLADLVDNGLLIRLDVEDKATGRTRTCGYYFPIQGRPPTREEIVKFEREVGGRVTRVSPWEGDMGVPLGGDTGVTGRVTTVSPLYEPPLEPSEADASSPGEGERAAARDGLVARIEAEMSRRWLAVSSRPAYLDALELLADQGVDLEQLPDCVKRCVASPLFKGRKVPVALEKWLVNGMWRGSLPDPELPLSQPEPLAAEQAGAAGAADQDAWGKVRQRLMDALTSGEFGSWVSRAYLGEAGGKLFVVAWSAAARDWIAGRCWRRICDWWAQADSRGRPISLVSKGQFEAALAAGGE